VTAPPLSKETADDQSLGPRPEWLVPVGLVVLAAILRIVDLPERSHWDADQGTEMLTLVAWVRDGVVPLLGPQTSTGGFHHGVLYYWLLAPAAFLSGANPIAVSGEIAVAGALAVLPVWWLARSIAGPIAGLIAGLLLAVSATGVADSIVIWNPSLIALPAGLALAFAWRAWTTGATRWWVAAAAASAIVVHCHVLGVILPAMLAILLLTDAIRQPSRRPRVLAAGVGAAAMIAASYLPLLAYDIGHDFVESRAAISFLTGGAGGGTALNPIVHIVLVGVRVIAWPLTGLVTLGPAAPVPAILATVLVVALIAWRWRSGLARERQAIAWLTFTLVLTTCFLFVGASSLTTVVEALPVDQYHAFLDPLIAVIVGVGLAGLARRGWSATLAGAIVVALVGWNLVHVPGAAPDGGFPAADAAAVRILAAIPKGDAVEIVGLPEFKPPDAYVFPLVRRGVTVAVGVPTGVPNSQLVVLCDSTFREAIGADCAGPAEDAVAGPSGLALRDRFEAAPGRIISVYTATP
jgi:hypothetical protein